VFSLEGGECTDWGYYKRPDIYNDRSPQDPDPSNWAAWTWAELARLERLTVNETPEVGAIVVWPISESSPFGHVAYVEAVNPEAPSGETVNITEINDGGGQTAYLDVEGISYPYEYETITVSSLTARGGVFIHQR
jgi:surface antigen